jgi:beta-lactam-binding protein with PASTA domain
VKTLLTVLTIAAATTLTACGTAQRRSVPNVTGEQLNVAEDRLDATGLDHSTSGGGTFGIVIRSDWTVCRQSPAPRHIASSVLLYVARSCSIPDVEGESLDDAEDALREAGIPYSAQSLDGDPIVVASFWTVCDQSPSWGTPRRPVQLFVSHDCYDEGGSW